MRFLQQYTLLRDEALAPLLGEPFGDDGNRVGHDDDAEYGIEYREEAQPLVQRGHVAVAHRRHRDHREVHAVDPIPVPKEVAPAVSRPVFVPATDRLVESCRRCLIGRVDDDGDNHEAGDACQVAEHLAKSGVSKVRLQEPLDWQHAT